MINSWYPAAPEITDKDSCSFTLTFSGKIFLDSPEIPKIQSNNQSGISQTLNI